EEESPAVDVAVPRETEAAWADRAADRGVGVRCQKPLAPTLADAEALVERVGSRVRLMVHENWRFRPWYRELRRWIVDGLLGEIDLARLATLSSRLPPHESGRRPPFVRPPFMQQEPPPMVPEGPVPPPHP